MKTEDFFEGCRILIMLHRNKDGGSTRADYHAIKYLTYNKEECLKRLAELRLTKKRTPETPYRIYVSVNERDMEKGIRLFKSEMLDNDYVGDEMRHRFYSDIKNRFIGCVQKPQCRKTKNFLIDLDVGEDFKTVGDLQHALKRIEEFTEILHHKHSKTGRHVITKPFNPNCLEIGTIHKDGLLFIE